jgi:hypothetical protein
MDERVFVNGVNGATGDYLLAPPSLRDISAVARGDPAEGEHLGELRWWYRRSAEATFAPREGVDPLNLAEAGWGVVFAHDADPAVHEALRPLLDHRRRQAGAIDDRRYREFVGADGYRPGETKQDFLRRHGAGPGPADPDAVPYYLLLVGDPESIPFTFQYQLDVQYAVGRLDLDGADAYTSYACSVVRAEGATASRAPRIALFGTRNPDDRATALSSGQLVTPLAEALARRGGDVSIDPPILADAAGKDALAGLLSARGRPDVVLTATHGIAFPADDPRQRTHQGALVCQEWPGPLAATGPVPESQYFSGDDVPPDADLAGLVAFHFACFGAGTPSLDGFVRHDGGRARLTARPFTARLPQRLLSQEAGGALAVVSHVDRAWGYSFTWPSVGSQTEVFASSLLRLLGGHPVGSAFEYFNEKYAEIATVLSQELEDVEFGKRPDDLTLADLWIANNDARNIVILGDPAVRLVTTAAPAASGARTSSEMPDPTEPGAAPAVSAAPASPIAVRPAAEAAAADEGPAAPQVGATDRSDAEVDFGMLDGVRQARRRVADGLNGLARTLQDGLEDIVAGLAAIEVVTAVADDLDAAVFDKDTGRFTGTGARAVTRVGLTGDVQLTVASERRPDDAQLWELHTTMVGHATAARAEIVRTATSALTSLVDVLRAV